MTEGTVAEQLAAGKAFADLSHWRKVSISGRDSLEWLDALVTADLDQLRPGSAQQALFLSPTGRIRAEFTVAVPGGTLLLIQDPSQPSPLLDLLGPYVLSSDVELEDRTDALGIFAFPGRAEPPGAPGSTFSTPSCLGTGVDVLCMGADHDEMYGRMSKGYTPAGGEDVEAWRILAGRPRFGVDALEDDLPQEAGLAGAVAMDKGCFPGQEAVAKVRNLGHPRRVLLQLASDQQVAPGETLHVNGSEAGQVTSAATNGGQTVLLARARWDAREGPFSTGGGVGLRVLRTL